MVKSQPTIKPYGNVRKIPNPVLIALSGNSSPFTLLNIMTLQARHFEHRLVIQPNFCQSPHNFSYKSDHGGSRINHIFISCLHPLPARAGSLQQVNN